jgi:hypothetical protein
MRVCSRRVSGGSVGKSFFPEYAAHFRLPKETNCLGKSRLEPSNIEAELAYDHLQGPFLSKRPRCPLAFVSLSWMVGFLVRLAILSPSCGCNCPFCPHDCRSACAVIFARASRRNIQPQCFYIVAGPRTFSTSRRG